MPNCIEWEVVPGIKWRLEQVHQVSYSDASGR